MGAEVLIPAAVGALGIYSQSQANDSANSLAKKNQKSQDALIQRQVDQYDLLKAIVQAADKGGAFDPTSKIKQMQSDVSGQSKKDMQNQAGAYATMGYKPGDTPPIDALSATAAKYQNLYASKANEIRDTALWNKISAYKSLDSSSLNAGIQTYGQNATNAQSQVKSLTPTLTSLAPYLNFPKKTKFDLGSTTGDEMLWPYTV